MDARRAGVMRLSRVPVGARAYDVTAVLTFSAAAARGALARGVCLDELSTKHSIRPDF